MLCLLPTVLAFTKATDVPNPDADIAISLWPFMLSGQECHIGCDVQVNLP